MMSEVNWNVEAEALYRQIVARVPEPHKSHVALSLRRGAAECAARTSSAIVTPKELVVGFFDVTPEAFYSQVEANLRSLGIDYTQYISGLQAKAERSIDLRELMADLRSMSTLVEVPFDEQRTWAAIDAYAEFFRSTPVAVRTTTKPKERRDLSVRYLDLLGRQDPDPLKIALSTGLVKNDGHPVFALFQEIKERCGAFGFGVDVNVRAGFSKIWMAPSLENSRLANIETLENVPQGVKNTIGHFARFGMATCGLWGFDFVNKTTNIYFMIKNPGGADRDYGAMLADLGFRSDLPGALEVSKPAHVVYYSFSWASERAERLCFAVVCNHRRLVPSQLHPLIDKCLNDAVFMHGHEKCTYSVVWSPRGHYFKIDNDYSGTQCAQLVEAGLVGV